MDAARNRGLLLAAAGIALLLAATFAAYRPVAPLGADAPPCAYEDIDHADCIFIVGSNAAFAHPILFVRVTIARKVQLDEIFLL
jgi:assimilatory nitrate reductase catalytic subunit